MKRQRMSLPQVKGPVRNLPVASTEQLFSVGVLNFLLPIVTVDVWKSFIANSAKAGYQEGKKRATWQWDVLHAIAADDEPVAEWLIDVFDVVEPMGARAIVNDFANVNQGSNTGSETHVDAYSPGATHRMLAYVVKDNLDSVLVVTINGTFHQVVIPSGTGIIAPKALLSQPHMHGTEQTNFCYIAELDFPEGFPLPTHQVMPAHASTQPALSFDIFATALTAEYPRQIFLGSPSRFGRGFVPPTREQSLRYLAVSFLTRAKGNRVYGSKKSAWAEVLAMLDSEVAALASQRGRELMAVAFLRSQPGAELSYIEALAIVRAMDPAEVLELVTQRASELGKKSNCGLLLDILCMLVI